MNKIIIALVLLAITSLSAQKKETYIYSIKGQDTLKLDLYKPNKLKKNESLPVLLYMHGGGFSVGTRDEADIKKLAKYATKEKNYIVVSISYRLLRKNTKTGFGCACTKDEKLETFKQAVIDYLDAAKFLIERSEALQIDTTKIIAGGSSAGAEGVLNAVFMRDYFIEDKHAYNQVAFAGVFSFAGAVVDASYINEENAVPTVLFHGTKDQLVPFGNAPHHYCRPNQAGYIILDGSDIIAKELEKLDTAYYFNIIRGGRHEYSAIPFSDLDQIFNFFEQTVIFNKIMQTKVIKKAEL